MYAPSATLILRGVSVMCRPAVESRNSTNVTANKTYQKELPPGTDFAGVSSFCFCFLLCGHKMCQKFIKCELIFYCHCFNGRMHGQYGRTDVHCAYGDEGGRNGA